MSEDFTRRAARKRSCYIILGIIFVAILLIAALVVGLYFGGEIHTEILF